MPLILYLDTSTQICSAALADGEKVLGARESRDERSHSRQLAVFVKEILEENKVEVQDLDAVAVSKGPGSYTGLRIGVSLAKGLVYGGGLPLIAVGTLEALATGALMNKDIAGITKNDETTLLCPMIDARRMEVYSALFTTELEQKEAVSAKIIDESSFADKLEKHTLVFFGNGADKCRDTIKHHNAFFFSGIETNAYFMIPIALKLYMNKKFEDIAYFEPYYLKDFIATVPKNKVLPGKR